MKLNIALENEKNRSDNNTWNKIFLHRDGKFYHAYEWSAWLIKTYVCTEDFQKQRGDAKLLSAFLYQTKNSEYVILGFPVESIGKYIPQYEEIVPMENGDLELSVDIDFGDDMPYETLCGIYEQWRATCEIRESKKQQNINAQRNNNAEDLSRMGVFHILSKVLSYKVEKATPVENIEFISNLKYEIAQLL
jgi:hypothetical protein